LVNITSESSHYLEALDSFKKSIQKHGPKKTISILKCAQIVDDNSLLINHIISTVLTEWKVYKFKKNDLFKKGIRGEPVSARDTAIYLVSQTTVLSSKEIADHFNLKSDTVFKIIKKYSLLSAESKVDIKVIERNSKLLLKIIPFTKKNN
jgi:chromosomal replication initiation ATPase DnaA